MSIQNIACWLAKAFVNKGVCNPSEFAWAKYRSELFLGKWITYTLIMIVATFLKDVLGAVLFIAFFTAIKRYTGGYHAKTQLKCTFLSVAYYILVHFSSKAIGNNYAGKLILISSMVLAGIVISFFAPINNPSLNLTQSEIRFYRKRSIVVFVVEFILILLMMIFGIPIFYISICAFSVVLVSIAVVHAKIIKQEVSDDER